MNRLLTVSIKVNVPSCSGDSLLERGELSCGVGYWAAAGATNYRLGLCSGMTTKARPSKDWRAFLLPVRSHLRRHPARNPHGRGAPIYVTGQGGRYQLGAPQSLYLLDEGAPAPREIAQHLIGDRIAGEPWL